MDSSLNPNLKGTPDFFFREVKIHGNDDILSTMQLITRAGTPMDAMEFIDDYATYLSEWHGDNYKVAMDNLGYLVGYLDKTEAKEILEFFEISHPLLGPTPWNLTPEEIFDIGVQWGQAIKEGRSFP